MYGTRCLKFIDTLRRRVGGEERGARARGVILVGRRFAISTKNRIGSSMIADPRRQNMYENLIYKTEGAIASIQLNRPKKKNSFNAALREEMEKVLRGIADNASLRTVIITGGEEIFCAGADIGEIQETASADSGYKQSREFQLLFDQVEGLPQPVIAAVSGYALGGGCELALACDFRFASATAKFGLTEVKIGAIPAGGGTQRLPRLIGAAKAKEIIFTRN